MPFFICRANTNACPFKVCPKVCRSFGHTMQHVLYTISLLLIRSSMCGGNTMNEKLVSMPGDNSHIRVKHSPVARVKRGTGAGVITR